MLKAVNVKTITVVILLTCFICMIAAYKIAWSTQRLPDSQHKTLQRTS